MALWAIVPVKPLRRNKSQLNGILTDEERSELNYRLLVQTINTLKSTPQIENILVISKDDRTLTVARDQGARTILEQGDSRINQSLARATIIARTYSMQGVLILSADLPLLSKEDINVLLQKAKDPRLLLSYPIVINRIPMPYSFALPV
jgi:2-phospho-L-lactate guanylyltransferase